MQLANIVLRLGGSLLHTVPIADATPAEILVLQHIHGNDAVVDVRPTRVDKGKRHEAEFDRLATKYDRAASASAPGEDAKSVLATLFPGAMKKLPTTLKEIGLGHVMSVPSISAADARAAAAAIPVPDEDIFTPAEEAAAEDEAAGGE